MALSSTISFSVDEINVIKLILFVCLFIYLLDLEPGIISKATSNVILLRNQPCFCVLHFEEKHQKVFEYVRNSTLSRSGNVCYTEYKLTAHHHGELDHFMTKCLQTSHTTGMRYCGTQTYTRVYKLLDRSLPSRSHLCNCIHVYSDRKRKTTPYTS